MKPARNLKGVSGLPICIAKERSVLYHVGMSFAELVEIMARLRDREKGCPWDLAQNPKSLKPYIIEEAYEVVEAIDNDDSAAICDELGDLLFQILFQARIQEEAGNFAIGDVIDAIAAKMRRRHPHIFGDAVARTPEEVRTRWEAIKREESKDKRGGVLDGTPRSLPALLRARRIGKKAANVGFDWPEAKGAWEKVREEVVELEEFINSDNMDRVRGELGDLLFALVNVARRLNINPEDALNETTEKFIKRFKYIESSLENSRRKMEEMPLETLDLLWEEAKKKVG